MVIILALVRTSGFLQTGAKQSQAVNGHSAIPVESGLYNVSLLYLALYPPHFFRLVRRWRERPAGRGSGRRRSAVAGRSPGRRFGSVKLLMGRRQSGRK